MNIFDLFDDSTRPKAPPIAGATLEHRLAGRKLAFIHEMHIAALDETKAMMEKVQADELQAVRLADHIGSLQLVQNYRMFGNLCGRECQFLDFHHTSEDREIFPTLRTMGGEGLKNVIDRLAAEHVVVHELLEQLADQVVDIQAEPGPRTFAKAKKTFDLLYKTIRSHFEYEQSELEEALGFYEIPL
jgi:hemerythrin-like domain-containing protein